MVGVEEAVGNYIPGTTFITIDKTFGYISNYLVLIKPDEEVGFWDRGDESGGQWIAERFYDSMEAFGGLPGTEYHSVKVRLPNELANLPYDKDLERLVRLSPEQVDSLKNEFMKLAIKNIAEHGENWNTKEYWEGMGFWQDR